MSRPTMTDVPTMDFKYELYRCVSEDVKHWKKTTGSYPFLHSVLWYFNIFK